MSQINRMPGPNAAARVGDDWETLALSRVSVRFEDLPPLPAEAEDFGWEEGVLERLRNRLNSLE